MTFLSGGKVRSFIVSGAFLVAAASILLVRFHLDFLSGFGYGSGGGALIAAIVSMRRGPTSKMA